MRTIINKSEVIKANNGQEITLTVIELLKECMNVVPEKGMDLTEIAARLKIIKVIDEAKGAESFSLEDSDFIKAGECVRQMRWAIVHQFVIDFSEQFK